MLMLQTLTAWPFFRVSPYNRAIHQGPLEHMSCSSIHSVIMNCVNNSFMTDATIQERVNGLPIKLELFKV